MRIQGLLPALPVSPVKKLRWTGKVTDLVELLYTLDTCDWGSESSLYLSEEPLSTLAHDRQIVASDRATMTSLLKGYDGFLISTGVRSDEMYAGIASIRRQIGRASCRERV